MKLRESLQIVLDLAVQNIIEDPSMKEERERQELACDIVDRFIAIEETDDYSRIVGKDIIEKLQLPMRNGTVESVIGEHTPAGLTRLVLDIFSEFVKSEEEDENSFSS